MLDMERKERKAFEGQALELIAATKAKWELNGNSRMAELTECLNQKEQKIKEMDVTNTALSERLDKAHKELQEKVKELERIKHVQLECKVCTFNYITVTLFISFFNSIEYDSKSTRTL